MRRVEIILFTTVTLTQGGQAGEGLLPRRHRVRENHEEATNNGKIAKEEVEIEYKSIAETLNDDNTEQTENRVFRVALQDDSRGAGKHDLRRRIGE